VSRIFRCHWTFDATRPMLLDFQIQVTLKGSFASPRKPPMMHWLLAVVGHAQAQADSASS
jgi:hypothetical protein